MVLALTEKVSTACCLVDDHCAHQCDLSYWRGLASPEDVAYADCIRVGGTADWVTVEQAKQAEGCGRGVVHVNVLAQGKCTRLIHLSVDHELLSRQVCTARVANEQCSARCYSGH